jgi:preprotein translocase subunit YajC
VIIGASSGSGFIFIIIIAFLLLYLIVVRPQKKRQSQQQQLISELRVGDEVLTAGGIWGTVSQLEEDVVTVEIAPGTEVRVARRAIAGVTRDSEDEETAELEEPEEPQVADEDAVDSAAGDTSNEEIRG